MNRLVTAFLALALPVLSAERPNILFIFTDDHALQAISAYGGRFEKIAPTPNIDRLAKEGMIFRNSFCGNSICGPSRAAILTGKHSHLNGFMDNNAGRFDGTQQTFPKLLQKVGYETALIGKWHLVSNPTGFDHWEILPGQGSYVNPDFIQMDGTTKRIEGYVTDIVTDKTIDWLKNRKDKNKPFVLMTQQKAPHRSWIPAPRHYKLFDGIELPEPPTLFDDYSYRIEVLKKQEMTIAKHFAWGWDMLLPGEPTDPRFMGGLANEEYERMTDAQKAEFNAAYDPENEMLLAALPTMPDDDLTRWKYQRYMKNYLRTIRAVDENIGRTLAYLEESGLAENTVVIYSSDQGFYLGEHGWYDKRWMFEESFKMPFVIRWPGVAKAGIKPEAMIQNIDYAPTFLEIAGAPIPADMQGKSIVPILKGEGKKPDAWRNAVFYQYSGENTHSVARHDGVRDSRHKLMRFPDTDEWMLFDLEKDPQEMKNIFANPAHVAVAEKMKILYAEIKKQYGVNDSSFPIHRLKEGWWKQRWGMKESEIRHSKNANVVFLGDSITQGWEDNGKAAWEKHFAPLGAVNWGYSGDRTEHLIWRLQNGDIQRLKPKATVILIGTNNTGTNQRPAAETVAAIRQILDDLTWKWPETKIVLMSVFPREEMADKPLRKINDEINTQLKSLADGKRVHLLDINAKFMDAEGNLNTQLLPDRLHLSPAAYDIWAKALAPKLKELGL
jgi:arylsulfatase A-like enzyme/lysophospholipase L1-like esterase